MALEEGRLNRYIARAGVCSRRGADALIDQGMVKVNGQVVHAYWHQVQRGDAVEVNGRLVSPRPFEYVLLNKPKDTITTARDTHARPTVLELLPERMRAGLFTVGRLDRNTVGVLLLTSDGELGHCLMHPSYRVPKRYIVRTRNPVQAHEIAQMRAGIMLEDGLAQADMAVLLHQGDLRQVGVELHEGRYRQVRRMLEALGHQVAHLERVSYANLTARGVRRGKWRRLESHEIRRLKQLVGKRKHNALPNAG